MEAGKQGIDTALARLLHETGQVDLAVLKAALDEVRVRRDREPSVTLAGLLSARGQAPAAVLEREVARLASLDDAFLSHAPGADAAPVPARSATRFGPYRVERELARGGMGAVFEVEDERSGARYALKTILQGGDAEARLRFKLEVEALGRLDHPHVVRVHAAELEASPPYLVQELLPGGSLQDRLREGPLPPDEVVAIGVKLCDALAACHAQDVLHRDLKPSNVMLDERGEPKLLDFGLVRSLADDRERLTQTGELLGTPGYLAPEQARAEGEVDARTDVYGLCATLFALLCGRAPFPGRGLAGLAAVVHDPPPSLCALSPSAPPPLAAVLEQGLAKRPEERWPDMRALAAALHDPTLLPRPRRAGLLILAATAAIALTGGLIAATNAPATPEPSEPAPNLPALETPTPTPAAFSPAELEAWREALISARRSLRKLNLEGAKTALAALEAQQGAVPDLPERASLQGALAESLRRLLPAQTDCAFSRARGEEVMFLLQIAKRLPDRPPLPEPLWTRVWRAGTTPLRFGKSDGADGLGGHDDDVQGLLADLDPSNIPLQERVLANSHVMASRSHCVAAARRLAAHEFPSLGRRLLMQVRLALVLGDKTVASDERRREILDIAERALPLIAEARRRNLPNPKGYDLPKHVDRTWLEACTAQVHLARARALLGLERPEEAMQDLEVAARNSTDPMIMALRVATAERLGRIDTILTAGDHFLTGVASFNQVHERVIGSLWRVYEEHGRGLKALRKHLARFLAHRNSARPDRWICLAWLDHRAGDIAARDERLELAQKQLAYAIRQGTTRWLKRVVMVFQRARTELSAIAPLLQARDPRGVTRLHELARESASGW